MDGARAGEGALKQPRNNKCRTKFDGFRFAVGVVFVFLFPFVACMVFI